VELTLELTLFMDTFSMPLNHACPIWLTRRGSDRSCLSFDGKVDGFGAELVQMVFAMSYTAACGALFCGVGWWATELRHGVHVPTLTQRLFGPQCSLFVLKTVSVQPSCNNTCSSSLPILCHFSGLPQLLFGSAYLTPSFITDFRSVIMPQLLPLATAFTSGFTVAMHVRRGDITQGKHSRRYTPDSFYFGVAHKIREIHPEAEVHVWSDSTEPRDFARYLELDIQVHLGGDVLEVMAHFGAAQMFVMGISSFSFIPGLLNPRCVLYQPGIGTGVGGIWIERLHHWVDPATLASCAS